jgi:hypothetical protein
VENALILACHHQSDRATRFARRRSMWNGLSKPRKAEVRRVIIAY